MQITWEQLAAADPELISLRQQVRVTLNRQCPDYWRRYEQFKGNLKRIVGWYAVSSPEWMRTMQAYDVAHKAIFG